MFSEQTHWQIRIPFLWKSIHENGCHFCEAHLTFSSITVHLKRKQKFLSNCPLAGDPEA